MLRGDSSNALFLVDDFPSPPPTKPQLLGKEDAKWVRKRAFLVLLVAKKKNTF